MGASVSGNSRLVGKPVALAATRNALSIRSAALLLLVFLSVLSPAAPSVADQLGRAGGGPAGPRENSVLNGTFSQAGEASKAGLGQDGPPYSLPSCCSWASVAAFLAASGDRGSHTMAETLYVLSTESALRVAGEALRLEKNFVEQPTSSHKRKGLMQAKNNLQGAYADLRVEMEAMAQDNVPGKEELLTKMKNALDAIQRGLSIHQRILSHKTEAPALLRDIRRLDRLLAHISADCREYLAGG